MRPLLLTAALFFSLSIFGQSSKALWSDVEEASIEAAKFPERETLPVKYRTLSLDLDGMKTFLQNAPKEAAPNRKENLISIEIPLPFGKYETFEIWETSMMQPGLAARFPHIKSFMGTNPETGSLLMLDYGVQGFHGSIRANGATYFIDPLSENTDKHYIAYALEDDKNLLGFSEEMTCGHESHGIEKLINGAADNTIASRGVADPALQQNYIMAIGCTGEFAQNRGGTTDAILSVFNTTVSRINQVWQPEMGVKVLLADRTDRVIFLNPLTDPYLTPALGRELVGLNQDIFNQFLNLDEYDMGHIMTNRCTDGVAGIASAGVCTNGKARGVTCNGNGSGIALGVMLHELGHQFTASHTWDNCGTGDNNTTNRAPATAFEPGSGSTLMSYSGVCGPTNLGANDSYYHNASIEQFRNYAHINRANEGCGVTTDVGNTYPEIEMQYQDGFYIPAGTPFELEGIATDEDGDNLFYSWEQKDRESLPTELGMPVGDGPLWRSYPATTNPVRSFPRLTYVLNPDGNLPRYVAMADYSRRFTFTLTVRDNHSEAGGTVWDEMHFFTTDQGGPFRVTSQASDTVSWVAGTMEEITWDVAMSNEAPVNTKSVDIFLSTDFGNSFPTLLAKNTPNDGSEWVFVPERQTPRARIKVKGSDNIFYQVNSEEFDIQAATEPGFTADISSGYFKTCVPDLINIDVNTGSILGYDSTLTVELAQALPTGAMPSFTTTQVQPGETAPLEIALDPRIGNGSFSFEILVFGENTDTVRKEVLMDFISSDFTTLEQLTPADGLAGVSEGATMTWSDVADADGYDIQVATNPAFNPSDIVVEESGIIGTSFTMPFLLEENTPFYWRVRPYNDCRGGDYLTPSSFHTVSKLCRQSIGLEGESSRLPIPGTGFPSIRSSIPILETGTVNDMNILNVQGSYETIKDIRISLVSPDSVSIILFEKRCNGSVFNFAFDDDAASPNPCPANDGATRKPQESLEVFNGKTIQGTWNLQVDVVQPGAGGGGSLEEWTLEYCANLALTPPSLLKNDTLYVGFGTGGNVNQDFLEVTDDLDGPQDLNFTVVTLPNYGQLLKNSNSMKVGDTFTQKDINDKIVWYENDGNSQSEFDDFTFTVRDSEGGWLATPKFNFRITSIVSTEDVNKELAQNITMYPNPANDILNIIIEKDLNEPIVIEMQNAQGQLIQSIRNNQFQNFIGMEIAHLPEGFYFVTVRTEKGMATKRLVIAR